MANRIDFFQSTQSRLALPAATISIQVDGQLCPLLEPTEIVRGGWPEFSWARLVYNPASYTGSIAVAAEDMEAEFGMGKSVSIQQYYNGAPPSAATLSLPIFCGRIEGVETTIGPNGERVEVIVKDYSANLRRITVYGRRVVREDDSTVFLAGLDTVFNPDGKANASSASAQVEGRSYVTFCAEPSQGKLWRYAEVIDYLLSEYLPDGRLQIPQIERLAALSCVDWVVPFSEDTPERLMCHVLPNVLVKGGDYQPEQIAGHDCVVNNGGEVRVLSFKDGYSSTDIIRRITALANVSGEKTA